MTYPQEFYYRVAVEKTSYTDIPTDNLDLPRALEGLPPWALLSLTRQDKQKKLILADWTEHHWSAEKRIAVTKIISQLITDGFSIYFYLWDLSSDERDQQKELQKQALCLITDSNINILWKRPREFYSHYDNLIPDKILKIAAQEQISADQVHILNDYWINRLVNQDNSVSYSVKISDFLSVGTKSHQVKDLLQHSKPVLSEIVVDVFSREAQFCLNDMIIRAFPKAQVRILYQTLKFSVKHSDFLKEYLITNEASSLMPLNIGVNPAENSFMKDRLILSLDLKKIPEGREFQFEDEHSSVSLQCLDYISKLNEKDKKINLWEGQFLDDEPPEKEMVLQTITEINMSFYTISLRMVERLLKSCPKLRTYSDSCNTLVSLSNLSLEVNSLPNLQCINLTRGWDSRSARTLILAAPHLEKISISWGGLALSLGNLALKKDSLLSLKGLNLCATHLKAEGLKNFLEAAPNLEMLALYDDNSVAIQKLELLESSLPKLVTLNVSGQNVLDAASLVSIFKAASHLKRLYFFGSSVELNQILINAALFPELEELILDDNQILDSQLVAIFKAAPRLKRIEFRGGIINQKRFQLSKDSLPNLERVQIDPMVDIEPDIFTTLIEAASNLINKAAIQKRIGRPLGYRNSNIDRDSKKPPLMPLINTPQESRNESHGKMHFEPTPRDKPFVFTGQHNERNHLMILEKFSHYCIQACTNVSMVQEIQDGICSALAHLYKDVDRVWFESRLDDVWHWNGQLENISKDTVSFFDKLGQYVREYQIGGRKKLLQYLGDDLIELFTRLHSGQSLVLVNPWHAITVRKNKIENVISYELYNSNSRDVYDISSLPLLQSRIFYSLGASIICVELSALPYTLPEFDVVRFISDGGLLLLHKVGNLPEILSRLSPLPTLTAQNFNGLLLRSMKAVPAWYVALTCGNQEVRAIILALLDQFKATNPDHEAKLAYSVSKMSGQAKQEVLTQFIQQRIDMDRSSFTADKKDVVFDELKEEPLPPVEDMLLTVFRTNRKEKYLKALATWDIKQFSSASISEYCQSLVRIVDDSGKRTQKKIIEFQKAQSLEQLAFALKNYCDNTSRDLFYIDSPGALICSAPFISPTTGNPAFGKLQSGPGGALYNFLMKVREQESPASILLVNYKNFQPDDIVRFNALIDQSPLADGIPLPLNTLIIGLTDLSDPKCYRDADFYSRFDVQEEYPVSQLIDQAVVLSLPIVDMAITTNIQSSENYVIDLFQSSDWRKRLLGGWVLEDDSFIFHEGELQKALRSGKSIQIQNGLWETEEFNQFWKIIYRFGIYYAERFFKIDPEQIIYREMGYDWARLKTLVKFEDNFPGASSMILNTNQMNSFFDNYQINSETNSLSYQPGLLKRNTSQQLSLNCTASLDEDDWAKLLTEYQQQGGSSERPLIVHCAPGVHIPIVLSSHSVLPEVIAIWEGNDEKSLQVIESHDIDATILSLSQKEKEWIIIDVSECQPHDLLKRIKNELIHDGNDIHFKIVVEDSALCSAFKAQKNIILTGRFSQKLIDALASDLMQKANDPAGKGKLRIITSQVSSFSFLPGYLFKHDVTVANKKKAIMDSFGDGCLPSLASYFETESLAQLKTRAQYLMSHEGGDSDDLWIGMQRLSSEMIRTDDSVFNSEESESQSQIFMQKRLKAVNQQLQQSPMVFLTGPSGVGKTTFVSQVFAVDQSKYQLFVGENQIEAWAKFSADNLNKENILFLDEANLSDREWSDFEGLFHEKPGILVNGTYYPLKACDKVIFAGNPVSYSDDRTLAPFFKRHGGAILFTPLSKSVVYQKILKPVFEQIKIEEKQVEIICSYILRAYQFICECSTTDILISPRELQMMALMMMLDYQENPTAPLENKIRRIIYEFCRPLIPTDKFTKIDEFDRDFFLQMEDREESSLNLGEEFVMTASRRQAVNQLHDRLRLHQWRIEHAKTLNAQQLYGGLGGVIFEGEPGIGKSELVIKTLVAAGYQQQQYHHDKIFSDKTNIFYKMPVSFSSKEKKELLTKAFNEGAIVLIDEINSSPMMEQYLNALLMGFNPDKALDEQRPIRPGFMVIGTQNPIYMAGRLVASTALQRRLTTLQLSSYSQPEMKMILIKRGIDALDADDILAAYHQQHSYAIKQYLKPVPCFRNVLNLADQIQSCVQYRPAQPQVQIEEIDNQVDDHPVEIVVPDQGDMASVVSSDVVFAESEILRDDADTIFAAPRSEDNDDLSTASALITLRQTVAKLPKQSPFKKISQNILSLTEKQAKKTDISRDQLTSTLQVVNQTIQEPTHDNALRCVEQAGKLPAHKSSSKLRGALMILGGLALIAASVLVALGTFGGAGPLSVLGTIAGTTLITAGIAAGVGLTGGSGAAIATKGFFATMTHDPLKKKSIELNHVGKPNATSPSSQQEEQPRSDDEENPSSEFF